MKTITRTEKKALATELLRSPSMKAVFEREELENLLQAFFDKVLEAMKIGMIISSGDGFSYRLENGRIVTGDAPLPKANSLYKNLSNYAWGAGDTVRFLRDWLTFDVPTWSVDRLWDELEVEGRALFRITR